MVLELVFFGADGVFAEEGSKVGDSLSGVNLSYMNILNASCMLTRAKSFVEPYCGVEGLTGVLLYAE